MPFLEAFSTKSWKMNAFNLTGSHNVSFQIFSSLAIFLELYLALMSSVESSFSFFSIVVTIHVAVTLFCYFGIYENKILESL